MRVTVVVGRSLLLLLFARGVWPYRGFRIGEATNPGPPNRSEIDLGLDDIQETAEGAAQVLSQVLSFGQLFTIHILVICICLLILLVRGSIATEPVSSKTEPCASSHECLKFCLLGSFSPHIF